MQRITSAIDLLKKIKEGDIVSIYFIKKDGTERFMKCTLNFSRIPAEHRPKDVKLENILSMIKKNILRVYDVEKAGWRSIPVENTQFIISKNVKYEIMLDKKEFDKDTRWGYER